MNKKNKKEQTELSYYGLYLLNYLKENKFEQANDTAFIKGRADSAAETYERARRRRAGTGDGGAVAGTPLFPVQHPA